MLAEILLGGCGQVYDWFAGRLVPKTRRESVARFALDNISAVETIKEGFCHGSTHMYINVSICCLS